MAILNAINEFRKSVAGRVVGATMLASAALASTASAAFAGDGKIGHEVIKGKSVEVINLHAANASSNHRLVLAVYGGGDGLAKFAYQVAKHYEDTTEHEVGLIEADDNDANPRNAEMHLYYNGERRVVFHVRPAADGQKLGNDLIAGMDEVTKGAQQARRDDDFTRTPG